METNHLLSRNSGHGVSSERVVEGNEMSVLLKLSTTTKIESHPSDLSKPSIKSIVKSSHT